jgi:DNA-binding SARP family transcriptional activator
MDGGKLKLNAAVCWVDLWALENLLQRLLSSEEGGDVRALLQRLPPVLQLVRGEFLQGEDERPWILAKRNEVQSRFHRALRGFGSRLEAAGQWTAAADLYRQANEIAPLTEEWYRRLMVCCAESGDIGEALQVYRRCRECLSAHLGVPPGAETERPHITLAERVGEVSPGSSSSASRHQ